MSTRAKFVCTSVRKYSLTIWNGNHTSAGFVYEAEFQAVTSGAEENASFFASTPSGSIKISTIREDVFEPGTAYYVDFSPVPSA